MIAFALLTAISVWRTSYGLLFLMTGLVLMDRSFAYLHVTIHGTSLYIVEYGLLILLIRQMIANRNRLITACRELPRSYLVAWFAWIFIALLSVGRGIYQQEPIARVVRDSMLVFYSLIVPLVLSIRWSEIDQRWIVRGFLTLVISKAFIFLYSLRPDWPGSSLAVYFFGQPASFSMLLSLAILFVAGWTGFRFCGVSGSVGLAIGMALILLTEVRSSWIGFLGGWGVLTLFWAIRTDTSTRILTRSLVNFVGLSVSGYVALAAISAVTVRPPIPKTVPPVVVGKIAATSAARESAGGGMPVIVVPAIPAAPAPAAIAVPIIPETSFTPLNHAEAKARAGRSVPKTIERRFHANRPKPPPAIQSEPSYLQNVLNEIVSFKFGLQTNNGQTRLRMWQDAVSELMSTGLYAPISMEEFQKYNVIWNPKNSTDRLIRVHVSGRGLQNEPLWVRLSQPDEPLPTVSERIHQVFKAVFGVPFGKLFLPIQIVWRVDSPGRYDPHNSWVAVLYRTGFAGFLCFLILLGSAARAIFKKSTPLAAVALAGMVYVLVHALTDNVLENSFKGLWLWIAIAAGFLARPDDSEFKSR